MPGHQKIDVLTKSNIFAFICNKILHSIEVNFYFKNTKNGVNWNILLTLKKIKRDSVSSGEQK